MYLVFVEHRFDPKLSALRQADGNRPKRAQLPPGPSSTQPGNTAFAADRRFARLGRRSACARYELERKRRIFFRKVHIVRSALTDQDVEGKHKEKEDVKKLLAELLTQTTKGASFDANGTIV
jgi:hypothetical protein